MIKTQAQYIIKLSVTVDADRIGIGSQVFHDRPLGSPVQISMQTYTDSDLGLALEQEMRAVVERITKDMEV